MPPLDFQIIRETDERYPFSRGSRPTRKSSLLMGEDSDVEDELPEYEVVERIYRSRPRVARQNSNSERYRGSYDRDSALGGESYSTKRSYHYERDPRDDESRIESEPTTGFQRYTSRDSGLGTEPLSPPFRPRDIPPRKPRSVLKPETERFPWDHSPVREAAPSSRRASQGASIPPSARWTKIERRLVNPQALREAKEHFEVLPDHVCVFRILLRDEIQALANRTREIREARKARHRIRFRERDRDWAGNDERDIDTRSPSSDPDRQDYFDVHIERIPRDRGRDRGRDRRRDRERDREPYRVVIEERIERDLNSRRRSPSSDSSIMEFRNVGRESNSRSQIHSHHHAHRDRSYLTTESPRPYRERQLDLESEVEAIVEQVLERQRKQMILHPSRQHPQAFGEEQKLLEQSKRELELKNKMLGQVRGELEEKDKKLLQVKVELEEKHKKLASVNHKLEETQKLLEQAKDDVKREHKMLEQVKGDFEQERKHRERVERELEIVRQPKDSLSLLSPSMPDDNRKADSGGNVAVNPQRESSKMDEIEVSSVASEYLETLPVIEQDPVNSLTSEAKSSLAELVSDGSSPSDPRRERKLRRIFDGVDKERTGELTMAQLQTALQNKSTQPPIHSVAVMLHRFDASQSGTLNFEEFCKLWEFLAKVGQHFRKNDEDQDGRISFVEFQRALDGLGYRLSEECGRQLFKRYVRKEKDKLKFHSFAEVCINLAWMVDRFDKFSQEAKDQNGNSVVLNFESYVSASVAAMASSAEAPIPELPPANDERTSTEIVIQTRDPSEETEADFMTTHLLAEHAKSISLANWKDLLIQLPEQFREHLEFNDFFGSGPCWTCTPSAKGPIKEIPLTIAGAPVVIPVEYHYPLTAATIPPPDPHPYFIDPSTPLDEETVNQIFDTYEDILGFYLLINGMLQVMVPENFDVEHALSHRPNDFGGLKVSYISQDMTPTIFLSQKHATATSAIPGLSSATVTIHQDEATSSAESVLSQGKSSNTEDSQKAVSQSPTQVRSTTRLKIGSMVQAQVKKSKFTDRYQGKIGLMTASGDRHFVTVPSHMLTQALLGAKSDSFPGNAWTKEVSVVSSNGRILVGKIAETFDPNARRFPHGFMHDVSLVDVTRAPLHLISGIRAPIAAEWLSQTGWSTIKYTTQRLFLLDSPEIETKSIEILGSRCQMVGQGIFKVKEKAEKKTRFKFFNHKKTDAKNDLETWTTLVSRSVLYRTNSDSGVPGALSGTAVCILEELKDESPRAKVAGFSSFVQQVSDVQKFDVEGEKLYSRLQEGRVAFYGAFQAPLKLRDEHSIVSI